MAPMGGYVNRAIGEAYRKMNEMAKYELRNQNIEDFGKMTNEWNMKELQHLLDMISDSDHEAANAISRKTATDIGNDFIGDANNVFEALAHRDISSALEHLGNIDTEERSETFECVEAGYGSIQDDLGSEVRAHLDALYWNS